MPIRPTPLLLALSLCAAPLHAQLLDGPPPPRRLVLSSLTAFRYNALGLSTEARLTLRQRLHASESLLLRDNFVSIGVLAQATPASLRGGGIVELQPLTILKLWATAEVIRYFGNFNAIQSLPSPNSDVTDAYFSSISQLPPAQQNFAATGSQLAAGATAMAKVGPVALRDGFTAARMQFPLRAGDRVYYDPYWATVIASPGWLFENDLDLVWPRDDGLTLGLRWTFTTTHMPASAFAPGEATNDPNAPMTKIGPVLLYRFYKEEGRVVSAPTVALITQWWVQHRTRTGAEHSQALPYIALAFGFWGDLLPALMPPGPP